ncbi:hypothetical protein [Sulfitobacter sp.]|uniref:hypothetical protein n=1 Tax=Sulfitobacter sp. TaxID=1903071 RepID=UPI0030012F5C
MRKRFIVGLALLVVSTAPVWFSVLRNEIAAFQLKTGLGSASLPDGAKVISSFSRVYNSGNSDGCDYEAIAVIEYYGRVAALQSSYLDLIGTMSDEEPWLGQNEQPTRWGAKLSSLGTEFSIIPNIDHASHYLVSVTSYARNINPDFGAGDRYLRSPKNVRF